MHDKEQLMDFLSELRAEYTPAHPELKEGIGHDIEHVKGAVRRADEIVTEMERRPGLYPPVDREVMATVSALHDIGNTVNRDDHALIGAGVARGHADMSDALAVPFRVSNTDIFLSDPQKAHIQQAFDSGDTSGLTKEEYMGFTQALASAMRFDLGYEGMDGKDPNSARKDDMKAYFEDKYSHIDPRSVDLAVDKLYKGDRLDDISYNPDLKGFTKSIHEIFTDGEIKLISDAIQDHNIDFSDIDVRYEARNVYGMVAADADKDNVFETFILRTFAYAVNKWPDKSDWFRDENGKPDIEKCILHVFDQLWERSREPLDYRSVEAKEQRFPERILEYKGSLSSIKGVISGSSAVEKFCEMHPDARECVKYERGEPCIIVQAYGDDIYSQIDNKFTPEYRDRPLEGPVLSLRSDCIGKMQAAAVVAEHPEARESLPEDMKIESIIEVYFDSGSIEEAVDHFEMMFYGDEDNGWDRVIARMVDPEGAACDAETRYVIGDTEFDERGDGGTDPMDETDPDEFVDGFFDGFGGEPCGVDDASAAVDDETEHIVQSPEDGPDDVERRGEEEHVDDESQKGTFPQADEDSTDPVD